jgi:hypothetical protein
MRKLRILPALALALSLTSACGASASGGGGVTRGGAGGDPGPSSRQVGIIVENNLVPSTGVTVYSVGTQGARRLLGTVPPGTTRRLSFDAGTLLERYRFVASVGLNREITSNPLPLSGGETVRWQLNSNSAFID